MAHLVVDRQWLRDRLVVKIARAETEIEKLTNSLHEHPNFHKRSTWWGGTTYSRFYPEGNQTFKFQNITSGYNRVNLTIYKIRHHNASKNHFNVTIIKFLLQLSSRG